MQTNLKGKHLITLQEWTKEEIETLLDLSFELKRRKMLREKHHLLEDRTFYMLFFEESTRTRNAFETGMTQLGGHAIYLTPKMTQIDHGETAKDTVEVLGRFGDGIGVRNCAYKKGNAYMRELAKWAKIPVINMQCDLYHPTQALADLMTIREKFGHNLRGLKFVISWTYAPKYIRPLSMPQSLILLMPRFGMDVTLAHPPEFHLLPEIVEQAKKNAEEAGVKFEIVHDMDEACKDAHVVYAKSWGPIAYTGSDTEGVELIEKYKDWVCNGRRMGLAKPEAIYMHCMPADRGIEVTEDVIDGPQSVIYDEAENRLHTIKAILAATMR
ncbi:MAG: ornithine carbamoyltransferase [Thermoanaerobacteraceae bacterium]|nr:ornithine carbamoyltransferase [Thermoanaerobacteraceae bacterium]